ncbi:hypothetical protein [Saccharopolyspora gregorii]
MSATTASRSSWTESSRVRSRPGSPARSRSISAAHMSWLGAIATSSLLVK